MSTDSEGREIIGVFSKFYDGSYADTDVGLEDRRASDRLYVPSYIDNRVVGDRDCALVSPLGKRF